MHGHGGGGGDLEDAAGIAAGNGDGSGEVGGINEEAGGGGDVELRAAEEDVLASDRGAESDAGAGFRDGGDPASGGVPVELSPAELFTGLMRPASTAPMSS